MSGRILPAPAPDDLRPGVDGTMNAPAFTWPARAGLLFVIVFFCAPLFIGLRGWDLRNDEAIYSYSVDRVLETGEWLTPRISPHDGLFLEKPPLKIWLVAGAMRLGLTPTDERGMRVLDVLFACVAFVYVYLLGWRLAGVVAGVVSAFLMFGFDSLIFEHGVRGNNMEAGVVLAYCGGMYHFVRWVDGASVRSRRLHALAAGAYFAFGFMTKFVAVLFLPLVWAVAFSMAPLAWTLARERWRDWLAPAALVVLVCSPWFVYETFVHGRTFWHEIVGLHVYARFAGTLVADHLRPWDFYLTQTWVELGFSRMRLVVLAGLALLVWHAWRRDWLARLYLIWWILPLTLVSLGTSKLYHYAFPFVPALALGGGLAAAMLFNVVDGPVGRSLAGRLAEMVRAPDARRLARRRNVLAAVGVGALALAVATAWFGPVTLEAFGVRLFRNSSPARAATVGILAWLMSGYGARTLKPVAVAVVAVLLPVSSYVLRVERFSSLDHPLRSLRDCALAVQARGDNPPTGVFHASGDVDHSHNYYFRRLGPWTGADTARPGDLRRRLTVPGEQSPVILSKSGYQSLVREGGVPPGIHIRDSVFILLPGPYEACIPVAVAAGGGPPDGSAGALHAVP